MSNLLKNLVTYIKYARYTDDTYTHKENYAQVAERTINMFKGQLKKKGVEVDQETEQAFNAIRGGRILPSMRAMQFSGGAIERNNQRIFNCMYKAVEKIRDISDIFYMLLCGCGLGYSVRKMHINQLPARVTRQGHVYDKVTWVIEDTIEGWAESVRILLKSYLEERIEVEFDYSQIRPAGSILKTTGGLAPGPEPLQIALNLVRKILDSLEFGQKLSSLQISDIVCIFAHCVLSGGNRRSALIALFDWDDEAMKRCKHGDWFTEYPYRSRANFSAMPCISKNGNVDLTYKEFRDFMLLSLEQGYGEPGYVITFSPDGAYGVNPCSEIALKDGGACNLTEINLNIVYTMEEFIDLCSYSAILGTIQASFTDFTYVSSVWSETCKEEALLGCGITGIQSSPFVNGYKSLGDEGKEELGRVLSLGAKQIRATNMLYAKALGINDAKRLTTIKPAGSTSCIFNCSSGIHPAFAEYFIRRVRISKISAVYQKIKELTPTLIEDALDNPNFDAVVSVPVAMKTPDNRYTKDISAIEQVEEAVFYMKNWIFPGHVEGTDTHNVSLTVHYKEEEKEELIKKLYEYRNILRCVSVFPLSEGKYPQQPFEEITKKEYFALEKEAKKLEHIFETAQETTFVPLDYSGACDGGACELKL